MQARVSIIIPVYNVEKYIAKCLESCIHQTLKEIEIIIVDDCGNDRSIEIAREYASRDSRVKIVYNKENSKPFACRNLGAEIASGEYLCFLDSDDFLDLNACEIAYNASKESYYDLVSFGAYYLKNGKKTPFIEYDEINFENVGSFCKWYYGLKYPVWNLWGRLIKREKYCLAVERLEVDGVKLMIAEDALVMFAVFNLCDTLAFISEVLYGYCYNEESLTNCESLENLKNKSDGFFHIIEIMENFIANNYCDKRLAKYFCYK
ncbi:glycosyltransferase family 2 protein [Helicobacter winghamensis]|uniref:glycosyltransferase family 2 protein n=1 Tax=Helicobacter winghamensis TaxID=157268 RepID=UPI0027A46708